MKETTVSDLLEVATQLDSIDAFLSNRGLTTIGFDVHKACAKLRAEIDARLSEEVN